MNVMDVLDRRTIQTGVEAENKDEVIRKMAEMLDNAGYLSDREGFIKDVYVRESEGETGVGEHIAIPHGKSESVTKPGVAIAVLNHEVEWESIDDTGARVVILFAVGADIENARVHLERLAAFSQMLGKESVLQRLLEAKSTDDVINAFEAGEEEESGEEEEDEEEDLDLDEFVVA